MTPAPRPRPARVAMTGLLLVLAACFVALGIWQVERRAWKHALIAAVDARVHATPVTPPGPADWPGITREKDAYRRVTVEGHFLPGRAAFVQAVTDLGPGYWAMAPFDTGRFVILVNRGFVTKRMAPPAEDRSITGLLRISEPHGGFLHSNDPQADRWYSRDVPAIAASLRLNRAAPYFIDADASGNAPGQPVGGLTVVTFSDSHLSYALTWFGMAALCLWGLWRLRSTA